MEKERFYKFDSIKFILIILVIYGHMLESNRTESLNSEIYACIYLFYMPLFILISGYFSKKYIEIDSFWKSEFRLFEVLLIFHIFSIIYKWLILDSNIGLADIVIPGFGSWYLLSLIYWRALLQFIPQKVIESRWLIMICVMASLLGGFIPLGGVLSIQRTFTFLPFFFLGYIINRRNILSKITLKYPSNIVILIIGISLTIILNNLNGGGE